MPHLSRFSFKNPEPAGRQKARRTDVRVKKMSAPISGALIFHIDIVCEYYSSATSVISPVLRFTVTKYIPASTT